MESLKNAEVLELLDNWTDQELKDRIAELAAALDSRKAWDAMDREQKDAAWETAVSAVNLGRNAIGIERDQDQVISARYILRKTIQNSLF